jgi:hypothetical protein
MTQTSRAFQSFKNKAVLAALAMGIAATLLAPAHALTVDSTFTVSVLLAARCTATNSATQTLNFGTYTAFSAASTPAPTAALTFQCTRGLAAPTFSFDAAGGGGFGVLAGLNYSLVASGGTVTTAGTAATAVSGGVGTADIRTVTVTGGMAAGQAGQCGAVGSAAAACDATAATQVRTLTITY